MDSQVDRITSKVKNALVVTSSMGQKDAVMNASLKRALQVQRNVKLRMPKEDVDLVIGVNITVNVCSIVQIMIGMDGE